MTLSIHVPIIRNNTEGLTSTNPLALMLSHEAALHYLQQHLKICHSHDGLTYKIAQYDLLGGLPCFTYTGQKLYRVVRVDEEHFSLEEVISR